MEDAQHLGSHGTLPRLLGPAQAAALQKSIGCEPWRGALRARDAHELFDWRRLNTALAEHRLDRTRLYLSGAAPHALRDRSGRVHAALLIEALSAGATLVFNAAQEVSAPLRALCEGLAAEFTCFCQANLYACWRTAPGFDVHWDDHDVIVVQAEGRKRWALYGATREAPLIQDDPADHRPPDDPEDEFVLELGDVLYLPRGVWHAAIGLDEPSLHITVGLTRRTGLDFLHWLANRLAVDAVVRRDLQFEHGDRRVADLISEVLAAVASQEVTTLAAEYRRHVEASLHIAPRLSFPALGGLETTPAFHDKVSLAPGAARLEAAAAGGGLTLHWRGDRFTVSARLDAVLRRLVAAEAVPYSDFVRSATAGDALAFVREMIRRGVFLLSATPPGHIA